MGEWRSPVSIPALSIAGSQRGLLHRNYTVQQSGRLSTAASWLGLEGCPLYTGWRTSYSTVHRTRLSLWHFCLFMLQFCRKFVHNTGCHISGGQIRGNSLHCRPKLETRAFTHSPDYTTATARREPESLLSLYIYKHCTKFQRMTCQTKHARKEIL